MASNPTFLRLNNIILRLRMNFHQVIISIIVLFNLIWFHIISLLVIQEPKPDGSYLLQFTDKDHKKLLTTLNHLITKSFPKSY